MKLEEVKELVTEGLYKAIVALNLPEDKLGRITMSIGRNEPDHYTIDGKVVIWESYHGDKEVWKIADGRTFDM